MHNPSDPRCNDLSNITWNMNFDICISFSENDISSDKIKLYSRKIVYRNNKKIEKYFLKNYLREYCGM